MGSGRYLEPSLDRRTVLSMETDPVHFFAPFMKSPGQILRNRGVFNCRGEKVRPPDRADFHAVLSAHEGSTDPVRFDRLDLSDADLRGLD